MPAGDGTGPNGMGAMTGRGAGYCAGSSMPGYANPMPGRGLGMGRGRGRGWFGSGRGWRHWYYATGLPRWARFGYAPAWGAPPSAAYSQGQYGAPPSAAYSQGQYGAPPSAVYFQGQYGAPPTPEQEVEFLKAQAEGLQQQLDAVSQRIAEFEQEP